MSRLLSICIGIVIFIYILNLFKVLRAHRAVVRKECWFEQQPDKMASFYMIIPVYKEQERIEECINTIEKICWDKENLTVCICTTEKEAMDGNDTESICRRLLSQNHYRYQYEIVRYPYTNGNMAEQVNYAFSKCPEHIDYISVYNADSVINPDVLKLVSKEFGNKEINYIQQRAIYNNYTGSNIFSTGYIFFQSIFEMKKNIVNDMAGKGQNVVGRALFIRKSALGESIYPTEFYCEDMALSMNLVNQGQRIGGVTVFEVNEPPAKLKDIINQQYVWFHTASKVGDLAEYARTHTESGRLTPKACIKICSRIVDNLVWLFTSVILLVLSILWLPLFPITYLYCLIMVIAFDECFRLRSKKSMFTDAFCYQIYLYIVSLGPIKCIIKTIGASMGLDVHDHKYKTPRGER